MREKWLIGSLIGLLIFASLGVTAAAVEENGVPNYASNLSFFDTSNRGGVIRGLLSWEIDPVHHEDVIGVKVYFLDSHGEKVEQLTTIEGLAFEYLILDAPFPVDAALLGVYTVTEQGESDVPATLYIWKYYNVSYLYFHDMDDREGLIGGPFRFSMYEGYPHKHAGYLVMLAYHDGDIWNFDLLGESTPIDGEYHFDIPHGTILPEGQF